MDPLLRSTTLLYYKRPEIQQAMVEAAGSREIGIKYGESGYGKRPDVLAYPRDILECVKNGATSFHCSEERWRNPLNIKTGMSKHEAEALRSGWDLVLDIDCPEREYARVCAIVLIDAIKYHGINSASVKFSGNNGFHVGIPFEAFPRTILGQPIEQLFPDGPRRIAGYLAEFMKKTLAEKLLERFSIDQMALRLSKKHGELKPKDVFDPYQVLKIDTVLISSRHLYRMPYSLHEKSGMASLPLLPEQLDLFDTSWADPLKVQPLVKFLDVDKVVPGEASKLLMQAFDFAPVTITNEPAMLQQKQFLEPTEAIPEDLFPPCIKKILAGLPDGKKRAMFVLTNFLKSVGWDHEKIKSRMTEWNKANPEPIREVIMKGHLRHHQTTKVAPPPACNNTAYYKDMGVCMPDNLCQKIKNPIQYAKRKAWALQRNSIQDDKPIKEKDSAPPKKEQAFKLKIKWDEKKEVQRVVDTFSRLEWYRSQGYQVLLPQGVHQESPVAEIKEKVNNEFQQEHYEPLAQALKAEFELVKTPLLNQLEKVFGAGVNMHVEVQLTKYGVLGSYNPPNKIVYNIANKKGVKTILHELIHLLIDPFVRKNKIPHWEKERVVDLILNSKQFGFLNYDYWQNGYHGVEKYVDPLFYQWFFSSPQDFFIKLAREQGRVRGV